MNLRKVLIAASFVALAACGTTKEEPTQLSAVSAEALSMTAEVTRITVQSSGAFTLAETNMTVAGGKSTWQNVNVTPGASTFIFNAYRQTAGSGSFTVGNVAVGDTVTVALGAATTTFTARESLQAPPSPYVVFNIGGVGAWGMATLAGVVATDTVVINGVTFTAVAAAPVADQFVAVAGDDYATAVNLAAAVNASVTAGVVNYLSAQQVGAASVRFTAAPGPTGNAVLMTAPAHFTFDAFSNHPTTIMSNLTAGNLAAAITMNAATKAYVTTAAISNIVTVGAKTTGVLPAAIALAAPIGTNVTVGAFASGADQLVGSTTLAVTTVVNVTTVMNVAILDTTTRNALEAGATIGTVTGPTTVPFTSAAPGAYATSTAFTFDASTSGTTADNWKWTVTATCPSGKGQVMLLLAGPYAVSVGATVAGPANLAAQTFYFRDTVLEACTLKIQVDKLRNIGAGGAAVVIGSDFRVMQVTTVPMVGSSGVIANVTYVQNPLILETIVNSKEGTCAIGAGACDPTVAYEGGVGPGECLRFGAPAAIAPNTGRCNLDQTGCIVATPAAWAGNTAYLVGDRALNNGNIYVVTVAGTSALSGGPSGTAAGAILDGAALTWNYSTPASGCLSRTYPDGSVHAQSCVAGIENGHCSIDYARCTVATGCANYVRPTGTVPTAWVTATVYAVGAMVTNAGNVYVCTTAGTSAAAPATTGVGIVDGTVRWSYFSTFAAWSTTHGDSVAQSCIADSFEDLCVPESRDCGFTDPLNPNAAATTNACTTGRKDGATQLTIMYSLGSPIANVTPSLSVVSCQNLDNTASMPATTALLSTTNSIAKFNVLLPANTLVPYWCTFNARVLQTVQTTPPLTAGSGDLADEQQMQVYVTPAP